jgi:leucyl-tRNA synthetase
MFGFAYTEGGPWNDGGIKSIAKFLDRIEKLALSVIPQKASKTAEFGKNEKELNYARNYAIKLVDRDFEVFSFNTAIARMMEYLTALTKYDALEVKNVDLLKDAFSDLIKLLAPCAPHFAEEIWSMMGNKKSIFLSDYPTFDEKALVKDEVEIAVQVNSKMKTKMVIASDLSDEEIQKAVLENEVIAPLVEGKQVKKVIVIKGRLVNVIV